MIVKALRLSGLELKHLFSNQAEYHLSSTIAGLYLLSISIIFKLILMKNQLAKIKQKTQLLNQRIKKINQGNIFLNQRNNFLKQRNYISLQRNILCYGRKKRKKL
jgi:hypothetical protein